MRIEGLVAITLVALLSSLPAYSDDSPAPIQASWVVHTIRYTYAGTTSAYNCDSAARRLKNILRTLGAHEKTKVSTRGCNFNQPETTFFITISTAVPAAAVDAPAGTGNRIESLGRMGLSAAKLEGTFPARWKAIDLSTERRLKLQAGDCDLLTGLREHVLPKLSIKVVNAGGQCQANRIGAKAPAVTVVALVPTNES